MNHPVYSAALTTIAILFSSVAFAQDRITGPDTPCIGSKAEYSYCRTENFPHQWRWSATADATVKDRGTTSTCYLAEVTLGKQSTLLTFHQSNPVGVPQVYNVTKQINPKKCEATAKPSEPIFKVEINWAEYQPDGKHPAQSLLDKAYKKRKELTNDKALALEPTSQSNSCTYVYWGCGSCPDGGAKVDAYCSDGGSQPDYSWCESC
jgi:hypothetical protein